MNDDFEINDLISKFLTGEASPTEAIQLEDWKAASTVNKTYFDSAVKIFVVNKISEIETSRQAWINIKAAIDKPQSPGKIITIKWWKTGIAASVILLIGTGLLLKYTKTESSKAPEVTVYNTDSVLQKIQLKDGSDIVLAANSSITLGKDFGKTSRNIFLSGSAFFTIKHDSLLPFVINMNQLHVKDVGTKFYISSKSDTVFVTMQEGEVSVYDDFGAKQNLVANNKAWYIKSSRKLEFYTDTLSSKDSPVNLSDNKKNGTQKLSLKDSITGRNIQQLNVDGGIANDSLLQSFRQTGYEDITNNQAIILKEQGITPDYIKSFWTAFVTYRKIPVDQLLKFKKLHITAVMVSELMKYIGSTSLSPDDIIDAASAGVTPGYIRAMQEKGVTTGNIQKYIQLKKSPPK